MATTEEHWTLGDGSIEPTQGEGWVVLFKTTDDRALRLSGADDERLMLRRSWELATAAIGKEATGRRVGWRSFGFRCDGGDALTRIVRAFDALVSDDDVGRVPWHVAAARSADTSPRYEIPQGHPDYWGDISGFGPFERAAWQLAKYRDSDPRSWLIIV